MATLDATPGGPLANSYVDVVTSTDLLGQRLYTDAWLEADATDQAAALMWATDLLDSQVLWYGRPATDTQALAWPQMGQRDHLGRPLPSTVIPTAVQQATALYALSLLEQSPPEAGTSTTLEVGVVKSRKVGDTEITYFDPRQTPTSTTQATPTSQGMPAEVKALLKPYAQVAGSMTVRLLRT